MASKKKQINAMAMTRKKKMQKQGKKRRGKKKKKSAMSGKKKCTSTTNIKATTLKIQTDKNTTTDTRNIDKKKVKMQ